MPFIHWLPKNRLRKLAIHGMLIAGKGPHPEWPDTSSFSLGRRAETYYQYSIGKTFYRDINKIREIFRDNGFETQVDFVPIGRRWKRILIPKFLQDNGFPNRSVTLITKRLSRIS